MGLFWKEKKTQSYKRRNRVFMFYFVRVADRQTFKTFWRRLRINESTCRVGDQEFLFDRAPSENSVGLTFSNIYDQLYEKRCIDIRGCKQPGQTES